MSTGGPVSCWYVAREAAANASPFRPMSVKRWPTTCSMAGSAARDARCWSSCMPPAPGGTARTRRARCTAPAGGLACRVRSRRAPPRGGVRPASQGCVADRSRTGPPAPGRADHGDLREGGRGCAAWPGPAAPAGGGAASALRQRAEEYLKMRRSLGYKLLRQGPVLLDFIGYLEHTGASTVTTEAAVAWATQPAGAAPIWWKRRVRWCEACPPPQDTRPRPPGPGSGPAAFSSGVGHPVICSRRRRSRRSSTLPGLSGGRCGRHLPGAHQPAGRDRPQDRGSHRPVRRPR